MGEPLTTFDDLQKSVNSLDQTEVQRLILNLNQYDRLIIRKTNKGKSLWNNALRILQPWLMKALAEAGYDYSMLKPPLYWPAKGKTELDESRELKAENVTKLKKALEDLRYRGDQRKLQGVLVQLNERAYTKGKEFSKLIEWLIENEANEDTLFLAFALSGKK